jgi:hypothetical protein
VCWPACTTRADAAVDPAGVHLPTQHARPPLSRVYPGAVPHPRSACAEGSAGSRRNVLPRGLEDLLLRGPGGEPNAPMTSVKDSANGDAQCYFWGGVRGVGGTPQYRRRPSLPPELLPLWLRSMSGSRLGRPRSRVAKRWAAEPNARALKCWRILRHQMLGTLRKLRKRLRFGSLERGNSTNAAQRPTENLDGMTGGTLRPRDRHRLRGRRHSAGLRQVIRRRPPPALASQGGRAASRTSLRTLPEARPRLRLRPGGGGA